jgi:hypothetical protein
MASAWCKVANGVLHGILTVYWSSFVMFLASIDARPAAAAAGAFGFRICRNV